MLPENAFFETTDSQERIFAKLVAPFLEIRRKLIAIYGVPSLPRSVLKLLMRFEKLEASVSRIIQKMGKFPRNKKDFCIFARKKKICRAHKVY